MSRFNTGNPLDSDALQDLSDNAKNADLFSNDVVNESYKDRFGRNRKTIHGMESEFYRDQDERKDKFDADQKDRDDRFNEFLSSSGYQFLGDYKAGVEITEYNQLVRDENGEFWRLSGQIELPYTTTGLGVPEDGALVSVGDAALRRDLANPDKGAAMVGYAGSNVSEALDRRTIFVGSVAELEGLFLIDGAKVSVTSFWQDTSGGGGLFIWDASRPKSDHDGGTIIDPEKISELTSPGDFGNYFSASGFGSGCYIRSEVDLNCLNVKWFGAVGDAVKQKTSYNPSFHSGGVTTAYPYEISELVSGTDDSYVLSVCSSILKDGQTLYFPKGVYFLQNTSTFGENVHGSHFSHLRFEGLKDIKIKGDGEGSELFIYQDITTYSLVGMFIWGCKNVTVSDISMDYQAIGWPDANTHPRSTVSGKAQTRASLAWVNPEGGPDKAGAASQNVKFHNCQFRLNHPGGAYPGAAYTDGASYDGSGKLVGLEFYGKYAAPDATRRSPGNSAVVIKDCAVTDCTFTETQARVIWGWMTENLTLERIKYYRGCGGIRPCIRMLHYNKNLSVKNIYAEVENDWKDGEIHEGAIVVSHNGGDYINEHLTIESCKLLTQTGNGILFSGLDSPVISDITIHKQTGYTHGRRSYVYFPIYSPNVTGTVSEDSRGVVINPVIRDVSIKGGNGGMYVRGLINAEVSNVVIEDPSKTNAGILDIGTCAGINAFSNITIRNSIASTNDSFVVDGLNDPTGSDAPVYIFKDCKSVDSPKRGFTVNSFSNSYIRYINCDSFNSTLVGFRSGSILSSRQLYLNCTSENDGQPMDDPNLNTQTINSVTVINSISPITPEPDGESS